MTGRPCDGDRMGLLNNWDAMGIGMGMYETMHRKRNGGHAWDME